MVCRHRPLASEHGVRVFVAALPCSGARRDIPPRGTGALKRACTNLGVGVRAAADAAHADDGQPPLGQPEHVAQHRGGRLEERPPAQAPNLARARCVLQRPFIPGRCARCQAVLQF